MINGSPLPGQGYCCACEFSIKALGKNDRPLGKGKQINAVRPNLGLKKWKNNGQCGFSATEAAMPGALLIAATEARHWCPGAPYIA
jgi:hypothetical protein